MPAGPPATEFSPTWNCRPRRDRPSKAGSFRRAVRSGPAHGPHGIGLRKQKRPPTQRPAAASNLQRFRTPQPFLLLAVADAINRAVVLVGHQQRAILHLEDI